MTSQHDPAPDPIPTSAAPSDGVPPTAPSAMLTAALAVDVVLVVVFAAIGRASHDEAVFPGLWTTAWPFLVGLAAGWAVTRGWKAPASPVRTGLRIWASTVTGGMLMRAAAGQGVAVAFVVVASITLFVFLVGWRIIARRLMRA